MAVIGEMHYLTIGNNTYSIPVSGGGGGTVTSVRVQATSPIQSSSSSEQTVSLNTTISLADAYGDTKNPYGTKTANYVLAGPISGSSRVPSFRQLVAADIPDLSASYLPASTSIPTKTSDLTNDSNFISDNSYVHTDNNYTTTEKNKLSSIASGAEVNVQANWNETSSSSDAYIQNKPNIPSKTSDLTNDSDFIVDASYIHTDNNYTSDEKSKLSGIAAGAEVNQNAFSTIKVGTTNLTADSKTDTLTITAGNNIILTPTANTDSFSIAATDTTYDVVTAGTSTTTGGLMSQADKTKLNGIATGAEVNVQANWNETSSSSDAYIQNKPSIPTATSDLINDSNFVADASYVHTDNNYTSTEKTKLSGIAEGAEVNQNAFSTVKVGSTSLVADSKTDTLTITAGNNITLSPTASSDSFTIAATDTTYSDVVAGGASGLMTGADKTKLNGIAEGAEVNVQSDWSVTSTTSDAFIKNKPSIPSKTSDLTNDSNFTSFSAIASKTQPTTQLTGDLWFKIES